MINLVADPKGLLIDGVPHAFNSIYVSQIGNEVELSHQYYKFILVSSTLFSNYKNSGVPFTSVDSLLTFLKTNAFK